MKSLKYKNRSESFNILQYKFNLTSFNIQANRVTIQNLCVKKVNKSVLKNTTKICFKKIEKICVKKYKKSVLKNLC